MPFGYWRLIIADLARFNDKITQSLISSLQSPAQKVLMRIAVFGTGGVGGYFGGRLAQAGVDVTFIARGAHLQAIQEKGLRVDSLLGDFTVHPAQATSDPGRVGPVDLVILDEESGDRGGARRGRRRRRSRRPIEATRSSQFSRKRAASRSSAPWRLAALE